MQINTDTEGRKVAANAQIRFLSLCAEKQLSQPAIGHQTPSPPTPGGQSAGDLGQLGGCWQNNEPRLAQRSAQTKCKAL